MVSENYKNEAHDKPFPGERWFPDQSSFADDLKKYWGDWGVHSETGKLKAALLRKPVEEIQDLDPQKYRFKAKPSPEKAACEHDELVKVYRDHGVEVYYVEETRSDRPNSYFLRDLMFMTPEGAIVSRPAMTGRRGEERYVAQALAKIGVPIVRTINGSGFFEGANGMWVDRETVILATGARANWEGIEQVEYELRRMGVTEVIYMQIPYGHAHIDGLLNIADQKTAMIYAPQVPYDVCAALQAKGFKLLEVPSNKEAKDNLSINFVALEPGKVVMPAGNPMTQEALESAGIEVVTVDITELLKGWGAIHCMTGPLKREG